MKKDVIRVIKSNTGSAEYFQYSMFSDERERLYFGNHKTYFPSIGNTLPGNGSYTGSIPECIKRCEEIMRDLLSEICTCPCNCNGCYAKKLTMYPSVFLAYYQNTLEMRENPDLYWKKVAKNIRRRIRKIRNKGGIIRVNDAGDFLNLQNVLAFRDNILKEFPDLIFYGYTEYHMFADILNEFDNAVFWKSDYTNYIENMIGHAFVDDPEHPIPEIQNMKHCPAIDSNGNKTGIPCNECKMCTKKELLNKICFAFHKH